MSNATTAKEPKPAETPAFDLAATPTLHLVTQGDPAERIQRALHEAWGAASEVPAVKKATAEHNAATHERQRLLRAWRTLNETQGDLSKQLNSISEDYLSEVIDTAAEGEKPDPKKLARVAGLQNQYELTGRALHQVAVVRMPLAEIAEIRAESHKCGALAEALKAHANQRVAARMESLRGAVEEEGELPINFKSGATGQIMAHSGREAERAQELWRRADELERHFKDMQKGTK